MYLFQQILRLTDYHKSDIYIPLCIYFNDYYTELWLDVPTFTFHYVSISTDYEINVWRWSFIYIPLCIYFNNQLYCQLSITCNIYIPLCIYFNVAIADIKADSFLFTFHYVSISTGMVILIRIYASIYIPLCIYFNMH